MTRIVVVSNRLPDLGDTDRMGAPEIPAGGLASAVFAALQGTTGNLWLGWSGRARDAEPTTAEVQGVTLHGIPLAPREVELFYNGFSNSVLWPLFHCFPSRVAVQPEEERVYRTVQRRFAEALIRKLEPGAHVWVNDYHLLLLARELRKTGWEGPTGFFLHIPFPPHDLFSVLPDPRGFLDALMDFDLVGFHVRASLENYVHSCQRELGARWNGEFLEHGERRQKVGVYPVGIDPEAYRPPPEFARGNSARVRGVLKRSLTGHKLVLGVDRLDYTKGIPERLLAFEHFLRRHPRWKRHVALIQIASPSRTKVPSYVEQKQAIDQLVGRLNGELAEHDWMPVRYLYRSYPREHLADFYREADVALVTPLRDGMNLVAKEFVAAQHPDDPGVLVLSRFAGAAEDLAEAVIVNPYVASDTATGLLKALEMPLPERRERHQALLTRVAQQTAREWAQSFLSDLAVPREAALHPEPPAPLPRRPSPGLTPSRPFP
jgi:alpha,alpha-trehalose-phosphate synthase [UDP-forming]